MPTLLPSWRAQWLFLYNECWADLTISYLSWTSDWPCVHLQVETSDNVQNYENSIYLRAKDAQACRVTSTLLLPVYTSPVRSKAAAVLEVTQFVSSGITYNQVFDWASEAMEVRWVAETFLNPVKRNLASAALLLVRNSPCKG